MIVVAERPAKNGQNWSDQHTSYLGTKTDTNTTSSGTYLVFYNSVAATTTFNTSAFSYLYYNQTNAAGVPAPDFTPPATWMTGGSGSAATAFSAAGCNVLLGDGSVRVVNSGNATGAVAGSVATTKTAVSSNAWMWAMNPQDVAPPPSSW